MQCGEIALHVLEVFLLAISAGERSIDAMACKTYEINKRSLYVDIERECYLCMCTNYSGAGDL